MELGRSPPATLREGTAQLHCQLTHCLIGGALSCNWARAARCMICMAAALAAAVLEACGQLQPATALTLLWMAHSWGCQQCSWHATRRATPQQQICRPGLTWPAASSA